MLAHAADLCPRTPVRLLESAKSSLPSFSCGSFCDVPRKVATTPLSRCQPRASVVPLDRPATSGSGRLLHGAVRQARAPRAAREPCARIYTRSLPFLAAVLWRGAAVRAARMESRLTPVTIF